MDERAPLARRHGRVDQGRQGRRQPRPHPEAIERAVEASLERLGTDRIDLLYLHVDDTEVAFERTLLAVDHLIRAGKVRWFGGAHHSGNRLYEARIAAGMLGVAPMVALQNQYNLSTVPSTRSGLSKVAAQLAPRRHAPLRPGERIPHRQVPVAGRLRRPTRVVATSRGT